MQQYVQLLEKHVEKVILGLAAVFTLYMLYAFMIVNPYTIEFAGKKVTPASLGGEILDSAKGLEVAVRNAQAEPTVVESFSAKLKEQLEKGIFADATVTPEVRRTVTFGNPIAVKGMEETDAAIGSITLVKPLAPSQPRFVQGRSSVVPKQAELTSASAATPNAGGRGTSGRSTAFSPSGAGEPEKTDGPPPVEDSWVTIASYYDLSGQREAMAKAHYRSYYQKPEFVGMDVERRERTSSGQWSDWKSVAASMAMPKVEIPEPEIDDAGVLKNREALNALRAQVRAEQARLMQPPFFDVKDGEQWSTPPLPGHEPQAEEDAPKAKPVRQTTEEKAPQVAAPTGGRSTGGPTFSGGGKRGGSSRFGGRGGAQPPADDPAAKAEMKKQAKLDLDEAVRAQKAKEYDTAIGHANDVKENTEATPAQKSQADSIIADCQKKLEAASGEAAPGATGTGNRFGPRGGVSRGMLESDKPKITLITNPEGKKETAVWFHDDSVEPGKTYQYRTRVRLWNRYVGDMKALQNPAEARSAVIVGDWSPESDEITIRPLKHFFVSAGRAGEGKASVEVWARHNGKWVEKKFEVGPGDHIGAPADIDVGDTEDGKKKKTTIDFSTGAIVIDVRTAMAKVRSPGKGNAFRVDERESVILTYIDPADGQVKERVQIAERHDPDKKRIDRETESA